jgi:hypothetical protein
MTSPEDIVYQALSAHAGIAGIVGTRISPMHSLAEAQMPCITYLMLGADPDCTHEGPQNMQDPEVQIDLWADINAYDTLRALRRAVLDCLYAGDSPAIGRYFFVSNDGTDMADPNPRLARKMILARVWYNEAL